MDKIQKCSKCDGDIDISKAEVIKSNVFVEDQEYMSICFQCPNCNEVHIFSVDNKLTNKICKELEKDNIKLNNYVTNGCTVTNKMKQKNIKLRLKLDLLRQTLYKNLLGKSYQLYTEDNILIKTGIFELPNLKSEEENNEKLK